MIFPISRSCYKIINHVFRNGGVKISRLLKETSVSQKIGYEHIKKLEGINVLREDSIGPLRIIKPNLKSETGRLIFSLMEKEKELKLINTYPKLKDSIHQLKMEAVNYLIESLVILGASEQKINILVISESNDKKILPFLQKCFSNVESAVSARILSREGFAKFRKTKQGLYQAIFKNLVCVYNTERFLRLIA